MHKARINVHGLISETIEVIRMTLNVVPNHFLPNPVPLTVANPCPCIPRQARKILSGEEKLQQFLQKYPLTKYVRLQWVDFSGVLRTRFVPVARCIQIAQGHEDYLLPQVSMIIPVSTAPKCLPIGNDIEIWALRPDWSSLRCCGFRPSHASVMCFLEHKAAEDTYDQCPRMLLSRALESFERDRGTKVLAGFEIEFMLLDQKSQPPNQLDRLNSYQTTAGLRGQTLNIVEEILNNLKESSINVHHFHTETHGQIEFALSPESPLDALDSLVLAQETIRTVFIKHNIRATMAPKPVLDGPTNGIHLHISVDKVTPPHTDSFLAAGAWVGFGTENRDLPVRKIDDQHWEFRMMDATSNPYLFTAAVLLAGLNGIREKTDLVWHDCQVFPHSLVYKVHRAEYGLDKRMPSSLHESLASLKDDAAVRAWMPEGLLKSYIAVKKTEVEKFCEMESEERRLRFLEYF